MMDTKVPPRGTRGFLIVLEGVDGSGKSTLARGLASALREQAYDVVLTKEPTDGPIGQKIRQIAASGRGEISAEAEFDLFHRDRQGHVEDIVRPALAQGLVVIQDRSYFSTMAYQGERGLDRSRILEMSEAIAPRPDLLLVVDLPAGEAVERIRKGRSGLDDFEALESLQRIRQVFLDCPDAVVIDGRPGPEVVLSAALAEAIPRLTRR